jgi:hypothetical protein
MEIALQAAAVLPQPPPQPLPPQLPLLPLVLLLLWFGTAISSPYTCGKKEISLASGSSRATAVGGRMCSATTPGRLLPPLLSLPLFPLPLPPLPLLLAHCHTSSPGAPGNMRASRRCTCKGVSSCIAVQNNCISNRYRWEDRNTIRIIYSKRKTSTRICS